LLVSRVFDRDMMKTKIRDTSRRKG